MAKSVFTDAQKEMARDMFKDMRDLGDVQDRLNDMPLAPGIKRISRKQLASLRSNMGLGPEQVAGKTRKYPHRASPKKNGHRYTALISGPGVEATVTLSLDQVADILRVAAR